MKIIDLFNKIANGEEVPKEIKYNACLFAFERQSQDYYCEEYGNLFEYLINYHRTGEFLNDEVEIIEEDKKIRKLDFIEENTFSKRQKGMTNEDRRLLDSNFKEIGNKINEIIDKLNEVEK